MIIAISPISEKEYGKELECKLADEDDLQSKSAMKEIVLRIF